MATIYDIAREANVSIATVSRILNGERNVAPKTASAVNDAIIKVGYVKRAVRPGRKTSTRVGVKTGIIDFLSISSLSPAQLLKLPYLSELLGGVLQGVGEHGMDLVLSHTPENGITPPILARRRADGVILLGDPKRFEEVSTMLKGLPVIWCFLSGSLEKPDTDYVVYDNKPVGSIAAEYLISRGHKHLAFFNSSPWHQVFIERRAVFQSALKKKGLSCQVLEIPDIDQRLSLHARSEPLIEQFVRQENRPTGIFCVSDDQMLALFNGLRQRGIEPGRDVELIGCNNDKALMEQMHPRPATIDLKLEQVGRLAVERLIARMSHQETQYGGELITPTLREPEIQ